MNSVVLFDKTYPPDMQAEGIAVSEAVLNGECNKCQSLSECCTNEFFKFPTDAYCMKRKNEILKGWAEDGK